jgi:hypothetical protein
MLFSGREKKRPLFLGCFGQEKELEERESRVNGSDGIFLRALNSKRVVDKDLIFVNNF